MASHHLWKCDTSATHPLVISFPISLWIEKNSSPFFFVLPFLCPRKRAKGGNNVATGKRNLLSNMFSQIVPLSSKRTVLLREGDAMEGIWRRPLLKKFLLYFGIGRRKLWNEAKAKFFLFVKQVLCGIFGRLSVSNCGRFCLGTFC